LDRFLSSSVKHQATFTLPFMQLQQEHQNHLQSFAVNSNNNIYLPESILCETEGLEEIDI
jgi:hypothetical protein